MSGLVLIAGGGGLLGRALSDRPGTLGLVHPEWDICDAAQTARVLDRYRPVAVINAAAQANVNLADTERDRTWGVNAMAPGALALACAARGVRCVHISTDYVLRGRDAPGVWLTESDTPAPFNAYGVGKLAGERAALAAGAVVVRVQWVYMPGRRGFFATALGRLSRGEPLSLVRDQVGCPTPASALADPLILAARGGPTGLFHLACQGETSAYDWIARAATRRGLPLSARSVTRAELGGAERPGRSCLDSTRFFESWGVRLPAWSDALDAVLGDAVCADGAVGSPPG